MAAKQTSYIAVFSKAPDSNCWVLWCFCKGNASVRKELDQLHKKRCKTACSVVMLPE